MLKKYDWLASAWAIIILILCSLPGNQFPDLSFLDWLRPDKIVHLILFGAFSFLLMKAFTIPGRKFILRKVRFWGVIISIAYGALIEVLQQYVIIDRHGDIRDAIANALGAFCGLWLFNYLYSRTLRTE